MIKKLSITNFKSIKKIDVDCSKVNIFIGEPNVGKSNILEALGFFSWSFYGSMSQLPLNPPHIRTGTVSNTLSGFVRFEQMTNLFYDEEIDNPIEISSDLGRLTLKFANGSFVGNIQSQSNESPASQGQLSGNYTDLRVIGYSGQFPILRGEVKFYRYSPITIYSRIESDFLLPPNGDNLVSGTPNSQRNQGKCRANVFKIWIETYPQTPRKKD